MANTSLWIDGRMAVNGKQSHVNLSNPIALHDFIRDYLAANPTLITGVQTLAQVLDVGNVTGAFDIEVSSGQVIRAVDGGGELTLWDGANDIVALTTDNGAYGEGWLYADTLSAQIGFSNESLVEVDTDSVRMNHTAVTSFAYLAQRTVGIAEYAAEGGIGKSIVVGSNGTGAVSFDCSQGGGAVSINSGDILSPTTFNFAIGNSTALGGIGITVKTANTAYVNQLGFCASGATFEGLLDTDTLTEDRTYELPDSSGVVDITRTIGTAVSTTARTGETILCNAAGGQIFITLPNPTGKNNLKITIKKIDATANKVTLVHAVGAIDGTIAGANLDLPAIQWSSMTVVSYGGNWYKTAVI